MNDILQSLYFGKTGQVIAPQGDAYVMQCPGREHCPYDRQEEEEQARFEQATGISCGKEARRVLRGLLEAAHFEKGQLRVAWQSNALVWDREATQVRAVPSRVEEIYGWALIVAGAGYFILSLLALVIVRPSLSLSEFLVLGSLAMIFGGMAPFAASRLVRPNRIARLAKPHIERYYADDPAPVQAAAE